MADTRSTIPFATLEAINADVVLPAPGTLATAAETASYIAEMLAALGAMARRHKLATLAAVIEMGKIEAEARAMDTPA